MVDDDGDNTFKILITSDNHVGYQENDPVRGDDSWKSFEEIMYIARDHDVDFVLQAGDLFHVNKPSKKSMFHVMKSLRTVCYGNKPLEFELLSDPSVAIDNRGLNHANFQDPNINVSIPLFAIAGNHDDSTGDELLDPMDLLSVSGLINHFGKNLENDKVTVSPLLLQKGSTKLALYGLSNIRDERLYKTFLDGNVKFLRPSGGHNKDFFNLLAVHQNHTAHTDTSYLPESFLPSFLDFTVWGHEHECIPYVTPAPNGGVVLQPGSSVATSLCPAEMARKHVFILSVTGVKYKMDAIPLKTARPFIMKSIDLTESDIMPGTGNKNEVIRYLTSEIEGLIKEAEKIWKELNKEEEDEGEEGGTVDEDAGDDDDDDVAAQRKAPLPLVRLKVEYTDGYEIENPRRFSNRFVGQIANVNDVVLFHRKKLTRTASKKTLKRENDTMGNHEPQETNVTGLVDSFLEEDELNIISKVDIGEAIKTFIEKEDKNALKDFIKLELEKDFKELLKLDVIEKGEDLFNNNNDEDQPNGSSISQMKKGFKEILKEISKEKKLEEKRAELENIKRKVSLKSDEIVINSDSESDFGEKQLINVSAHSSDFEKPPATRVQRQRAKRLTASKKKLKEITEIVSDSDEEVFSEPDFNSDGLISDEDIVDIPPPKTSARRGRGGKISKPSTRGAKTASRGGRKKLSDNDSQNVMDLVTRMSKK